MKTYIREFRVRLLWGLGIKPNQRELPTSRALLAVSLVAAGAAGWPMPALAQVPVDVVGTLTTAEYNTFVGDHPEYNEWGFEPFIAVNPVDPNKIVISSSAYNSAFSDGASLWYSTDGGKTRGIRFPIKNPPSGQVPYDQVYAYDSAGVLHGVLLAQGNTAPVRPLASFCLRLSS